MPYPFDKDSATALLATQRTLLERGLSYVEKVLALHASSHENSKVFTRGKDTAVFSPDRVAMQDATAQMAMLQFMQAEQTRTVVPATVHCDHLLRARDGAESDLNAALTANREVYDFLSSSALKYGIGFWGPGSGIIHQVLFENYAVPGAMMIGTDSHTPNAGGLGMLAIGVGGADAAEVMAGLPWETVYPRIVGVRLYGRLSGWASAKDVAFEMLRRFSVTGGTGKIFEYYGDGALSLSATQKATITNMGAEMGATASVFVYDHSMDEYLRNVGRPDDASRGAAMADVLNQDEVCLKEPEKVFDEVVEIDLGAIRPSHAGPFSPDRIIEVRRFRQFLKKEKWPETVSAVLLGSCTNSSYSDLCAAAQVLEQAGRHGLKAQVPFMLSPGSQQVYETIRRDGVLDTLVAAGALILTASCGPCIGQWDRKDVPKGTPNSLFTTCNRNFRGRNDSNPETLAFLTSPAMAAALALASDAGFDPEKDVLVGTDGERFALEPPRAPALPSWGMAQAKKAFVPPSADGARVRVEIDPHSERLERLRPFKKWDGTDFIDLPVLVKTRGKTTTDHISPGGKWLRYRGHLSNISRNMLEGAVNAFTGETGQGTNIITHEKSVKFSEIAKYYRDHAGGCVIVGDENYGEGSSREHAAMSPRLLGVKVVVARSFARIHEANLKKQGILALTFSDPSDYEKIGQDHRLSFVELGNLRPGEPVKTIAGSPAGEAYDLECIHTLTERQIRWFRAGSALNTLKERKEGL